MADAHPHPDPHTPRYHADPAYDEGSSRGTASAEEGLLRPIQQSDYFSTDPAVNAEVSRRIDQYFNQRLEIFPDWDREVKPDRFHVIFHNQIKQRFPDDKPLRQDVHGYGRRVFRALCVHVGVKRLTQGLTLAAFVVLAGLAPTVFAGWAGSLMGGLAVAGAGMLVAVGLFFAASSLLFVQYRFRLENDTYELSREIVERTRELQNLFTQGRALADQEETHYAADPKGWGQRALYLTRLVLWLGSRMEYLEKFVQMELWRVRRERYWMRWVGRFTAPLVLIAGLAALALEPAPVQAAGAFRGLQGLGVFLALLVSWMSYFRWQTPTAAVRDKLGVDSWVRYASLDVDNAVGDQVRRDKERLVEYRALTRGGR